MNTKSAIGVAMAATLLVACSPEPPLYFGPQLASVRNEAEPGAINSLAFSKRPPLPGQPNYLETIGYINDRVKYIDPSAEFFISFDGQMCFRGLVNRQEAYFENYQNYWCMRPSQVNNVEVLKNNISYVNTVRLWCSSDAPQCARRFGYPNFLDESGWMTNSITVQTVAYRQQRDAIEYLVYLMGGRAGSGKPSP